MNAAAAHAPSFGTRLRAIPRRQLLLLALVPVLVVVWVPVVTGGRRAATPPPPAASAPVAGPAAAPLAPPPAAPGAETALVPTVHVAAGASALIARLRLLTAPYAPRWTPSSGEPFASAPAPAPVDVVTTTEPLLAPSAIVLSRSAPPIAIVQGRTCGVGDTVAGRTIVAIEERRVVYRDGDATFAVVMPVPTLGARQ